MPCAVLYTTELRAPELEGPAVRLLTWNVASLRASLKKVRMPHWGLCNSTVVSMPLCNHHYHFDAVCAQGLKDAAVWTSMVSPS